MDKPITGAIEVTPDGWLHIRLDTLLPHCRYGSVSQLSNGVFSLLEQYDGNLPFFKRSLLVIDEHCSEKNRRVFDQDNKGWKAIPNSLKGFVFEDDDDRTLSILLTSMLTDETACHVYVMPLEDGVLYFQRAISDKEHPM